MGNRKIASFAVLPGIMLLVLIFSSCEGPAAPGFTPTSDANFPQTLQAEAQSTQIELMSPTPIPGDSTTPLLLIPETITACPPDGWIVYTIQEGDTLYNLAQAYYTDVETLLAANCLSDDFLSIGQALYVPNVATRIPPEFALTPTVTPQPPDLNALLAEKVNRLQYGLMTFNPPDRMKPAKPVRVELRIAPAGPASQAPTAPAQTAVTNTLGEGIEPPEAAVNTQVGVGAVVKASLTGGTEDEFEITPLSAEEQLVNEDTYTIWAWNVLPLKSGERELNLAVAVKVTAEGFGEQARDLPVISRTIIVGDGPVYTTTTFFRENWKWLWIILLVLVVGWVVFRKKRADHKEAREERKRRFG